MGCKIRMGPAVALSKVKVWLAIGKELSTVSQCAFPRWTNFDSNQPVYLHVFTDASKSVIGSVAYLTQGTRCILLSSKSKLSPHGKKTLTIPQLEFVATPFWLLYFPCHSLRALIFLYMSSPSHSTHTHYPHITLISMYVIASNLLFTSIVIPEYTLPFQASLLLSQQYMSFRGKAFF